MLALLLIASFARAQTTIGGTFVPEGMARELPLALWSMQADEVLLGRTDCKWTPYTLEEALALQGDDVDQGTLELTLAEPPRARCTVTPTSYIKGAQPAPSQFSIDVLREDAQEGFLPNVGDEHLMWVKVSEGGQRALLSKDSWLGRNPGVEEVRYGRRHSVVIRNGAAIVEKRQVRIPFTRDELMVAVSTPSDKSILDDAVRRATLEAMEPGAFWPALVEFVDNSVPEEDRQ